MVPTVVWGFIVLIVGCCGGGRSAAGVTRSRGSLGVIPFLIVLFPFYVYLERALPNGY